MATELDVRRQKSTGLLLAALSFSWAAMPVMAEAQLFSAKEMRGRVLDRETGDPLENAVVVATWMLTPTAGLFHERYDGRLNIVETLTDARGEWKILGWGPKLLPPFRKIDETMPEVGAYKPGYVQEWVQGQKELAAPGALEIQLRRVADIVERSRQAEYFFMALHGGTPHDEIEDWPNYPKTTVIMIREDAWLRENGSKRPGPSVPEPDRLPPDQRALLERAQREVLR